MHTDTEKTYLLKAVDALQREFIVISPDYKILAANRFTREKRGHDIIGKNCHDLLFQTETPCDECQAERFKAPGAAAEQDIRAEVCKDTGLSFYPICSDGNIDALAMMDFDLPALGKLEEELNRSNAFFRNLIFSSVDAVIAADKKGKILVFNQAAAEISGFDIDTALNKLDIRDVYPEDGARDVMRLLRSDDHGGKGKLKSYQVSVLNKAGELIPIRLNAAIVYEGGREVATIGFFHDLRESQRIEKELEQTRMQLLQSEKMASLGKLAAGVAHQINNPLGGITLFAKLMLEEYKLEGGVKDDLERILRDAERCRDTVKELLEFTRQTRHFMQPHDINKALSRTLFLLENQSLFQNINIEKRLGENLPLVVGDIQQLNHMFMNIILNAAQAMDGNGRLTLETGVTKDKQTVTIAISDTGPGIPEEIQAHIFDPFFTTKEEGKGTGLGLSLVYNIVKNHGGRITHRSIPGEETTFTIELPVTGPPEKGEEDDGKR